MKKTLLSIGLLLLTSLCPNFVHATDARPYIEAHVGPVIGNDSTLGPGKVTFDPGFVAGAAVGMDFELLRIEANVDYRRAKISKYSSIPASGDLQLASYMVNGHLVAPLPYPVKPYLLGGVGFATAFMSNFATLPGGRQNSTRFAYELGAGVGFDIKRNVTLDVNYRYLRTSDFDFSATKFSYSSNNVLFGVRYLY
jgi:opacity protein-like surface antigen